MSRRLSFVGTDQPSLRSNSIRARAHLWRYRGGYGETGMSMWLCLGVNKGFEILMSLNGCESLCWVRLLQSPAGRASRRARMMSAWVKERKTTSPDAAFS
eukprot:scaffold46903_cov15-Tisochrysis_lutea.AAC.2